MKTALYAAALLAACALSAAAAPIKLDTGRVEGTAAEGVLAYKGLPYAAPPVGDLRWRAPQPAAAWKGVFKAAAFAPACLQEGVSMPGEPQPKTSEDCLYLNVWTPAHAAGVRLPVMVFIHGGGWANGATSLPLYGGDRLAKRGVVVVTLAYRLGPLGFLAHPELSKESGGSGSGDYGLMDQIAALQWVKRNIAAFGGDPDRVTIFGQSAGAMAVSALIASPQAHGLFQRAIGESGGLFEPMQLAPSYLLPQAEKDGATFAKSLGANSIAELRRLPGEAIVRAPGAKASHPVIGTAVLPLSPWDAYVAGKLNDVPILVGSNAEEARSLTDVSKVTAANFEAGLTETFGPLPAQLYAAYPRATDADAKAARLAFERDLRFGWDMWTWARLAAQRGKAKTFYYRFDQRPPFPEGSVREGWGASHFAELWYVFDHLDQEPWRWTPADQRLADQIAGYWTNFAKQGDPNGPGLPFWPKFEMRDQKVLQLDGLMRVDGVVDQASLQAFDAVYGALRGTPAQ